jgi:hypothetical protein
MQVDRLVDGKSLINITAYVGVGSDSSWCLLTCR